MSKLGQEKLQIGRSLLTGGPITQESLQQELERSGKSQSQLGKALLQSGFPREEELILPLLSRLRIPRINAKNTKIPLETIRLIPEEVARRHNVLAIDQLGGVLVVVTPNIDNPQVFAEVRRATNCLVTPIQCAPEGFDQIVSDYYRRLSSSGLAPAAPAAATAAAPGANGALRAIPADGQDEWWKRYESAGPVVAVEAEM